MKTMNIKTTKRDLLPKCWLHEENSYNLIGKDGRTLCRELPRIPSKYKDILEARGIPYRNVTVPNKHDPSKDYILCEYWNAELYEEETKQLPLYEKVEDEYEYTGTLHSQVLPTFDTVKKAEETKKEVLAAIREQKTAIYNEAKAALNGAAATVVEYKSRDLNLKQGKNHIKLLQAYNSAGSKTGYCGVFDMNQLNADSEVILQVPSSIAGIIIGKQGKNKKRWEEELKVKEIRIDSIKEQ